MIKKTAAFLTLGCKVNSYETDAMVTLFTEAGYQIKEFANKADIYVVNTCTVTNIADRKSRQMLHKAKKNNPEAVIVAVGCYVQAAKETLEADESIDIVIGNNQKNDIVSIVEGYFTNEKMKEAVLDISQETEYEPLVIRTVGEKNRAYIKIQDGCNQFCSYCIIPYARGRVRSRKAEPILEEVAELVKKGYLEVVLTGIHLSSYGADFPKNQNQPQNALLRLIGSLNEIAGLRRIRLGSLEPLIMTEDFVKQLASFNKVCPHFHLSLQSGCDSTLQRMNRKYTAEQFLEKTILLRKYFDYPALTTDVIVGFPGETEDEFQITKRFLERASFAQMHIFKYSKRKGTRAESMPNQVDDKIKNERSSILLELDAKLGIQYKENLLESKDEILVEEKMSIQGETYLIGHNERYVKVALLGEENLINQIVPVKICTFLNDEILLSENLRNI